MPEFEDDVLRLQFGKEYGVDLSIREVETQFIPMGHFAHKPTASLHGFANKDLSDIVPSGGAFLTSTFDLLEESAASHFTRFTRHLVPAAFSEEHNFVLIHPDYIIERIRGDGGVTRHYPNEREIFPRGWCAIRICVSSHGVFRDTLE